MPKIDLGKKYDAKKDSCCTIEPAGLEGKISYPTVYVSDIDGLDTLPDGEFTFKGTGKVVSITESTRNGKYHCSCEIEIQDITPDSTKQKPGKSTEESLDDALDTVAKKKADDAEDMADDGADEDTE